MKSMNLTDGEKLILKMLSEIYERINVEGDIDPVLVQGAIQCGHSWALKRTYSGLFEIEERDPEIVKEVYDILTMWRHIQQSYGRLSEDDKQQLKTKLKPLGDDLRFPGFDGHSEMAHLSVAKFVIQDLKNFPGLQVRSFNSHCPTLGRARRMLAIFKSLKVPSLKRELNGAELIKLLKAEVLPVLH